MFSILDACTDKPTLSCTIRKTRQQVNNMFFLAMNGSSRAKGSEKYINGVSIKGRELILASHSSVPV